MQVCSHTEVLAKIIQLVGKSDQLNYSVTVKQMKNSLTQAAPEMPKQNISGVFTATDETIFELFH